MECLTLNRVWDDEKQKMRPVVATDQIPRYKPKVRIMSPLQMVRARGGTKMNAYRCSRCGYVHVGNPRTVRSAT